MLLAAGWLAIFDEESGVICAVACALLKFTVRRTAGVDGGI